MAFDGAAPRRQMYRVFLPLVASASSVGAANEALAEVKEIVGQGAESAVVYAMTASTELKGRQSEPDVVTFVSNHRAQLWANLTREQADRINREVAAAYPEFSIAAWPQSRPKSAARYFSIFAIAAVDAQGPLPPPPLQDDDGKGGPSPRPFPQQPPPEPVPVEG